MRAGRARVSWTRALTSGLSALSVTGSTGRLATLGKASVAGRLAGRLSTLSLARLAGRRACDAGSLTLRLTSIASYATRIARTCVALCAACSAARTEAGIPAARTSEAGVGVARSPAAVGAARGIELCPKANRRSELSTTAELDIKVELVPRFMRA